MKNQWEVGCDDVLNCFVISRIVSNKAMAREWIMMPYRRRVKVWTDKTKAEAYAKRLNRRPY